MTGPSREYHRLPGRGRTLAGISTLWLGPDHLLAVDGRGYSENYRRFYYRDIQAIATVRTSRWIAMAALFGLAAAAVGWGFLASSSELRWIWMIPGIPLLLLFLLNLLYGPTCVCRITTAAQTVPLPSLTRAPSARRALERIRARVEAEQGTRVEEAAVTGSPEPVAEAAPAAAPTLSPLQPPSLPARRDTTRLHGVLFWSLIADSVLTVVSLAVKESGAFIAGAALLVIEFGLAIVAIVRQRRTDIPPGIRRLVWATLAYLCLSVALIVLATWLAAFRTITGPAGQSVSTGGRNVVLDAFGVVAPLLLGTSGLVLLHRFSSDRQEADLSLFSRP